MQHARSNRRGVRLLKWVERLFVMGGIAALAWCGFVLSDAYMAQWRGRETLESFPHGTPPSPGSSSGSSDPSPSGAARPPLTRGTPLAELSIPRLGLSAVVLHGSDAQTLRLGLGHVENTPLPGEPGNVAIAGHRDTFFRPLRNIQIGDDVLLDTPEERVHYRVSSFRVVNSYEVSVIGPTKDASVTLVTCYPFWFIGQAPDRFVVRATRVEDPSAAATTLVASRTREPNRQPVVHSPRIASEKSVAVPRPAEKSESIARVARESSDDDTLVRKAVERFRVMYNAGAARQPNFARDGLMTFRFCEVAVSETTANATCNSASAGSAEGVPSPVWTVSLSRIGGEWTVRSVAMK